jgi:hypothetical protein
VFAALIVPIAVATAAMVAIVAAMVAMLSPKGFLGMVHGGSGELLVALA